MIRVLGCVVAHRVCHRTLRKGTRQGCGELLSSCCSRVVNASGSVLPSIRLWIRLRTFRATESGWSLASRSSVARKFLHFCLAVSGAMAPCGCGRDRGGGGTVSEGWCGGDICRMVHVWPICVPANNVHCESTEFTRRLAISSLVALQYNTHKLSQMT